MLEKKILIQINNFNISIQDDFVFNAFIKQFK